MTVSVIIPAYNAALFLARTIDSVLAQDYPVAQLILVDNNSTDATLAIMHSYQQRYPERTIVSSCRKQGASAARNQGLALATGDWIQFLDADDTLDTDKLSTQLGLALPDTDWIIGGFRNVYPGGAQIENIPHPDPWQGLVFGYRTGCTHANLFRRQVLLNGIAWEEALPDNQDPTLYFALLRTGTRWQIVPKVACTYHHHPTHGRISLRDPTGGNARRVALLQAVNAHLASSDPNYWREHAAYFQAALLRALRVLATHDLALAATTFQAAFPGGLSETDWTQQRLLPSWLPLAYGILGFRTSERLRLQLVPLLPARWLRTIKQHGTEA